MKRLVLCGVLAAALSGCAVANGDLLPAGKGPSQVSVQRVDETHFRFTATADWFGGQTSLDTLQPTLAQTTLNYGYDAYAVVGRSEGDGGAGLDQILDHSTTVTVVMYRSPVPAAAKDAKNAREVIKHAGWVSKS